MIAQYLIDKLNPEQSTTTELLFRELVRRLVFLEPYHQKTDLLAALAPKGNKLIPGCGTRNHGASFNTEVEALESVLAAPFMGSNPVTVRMKHTIHISNRLIMYLIRAIK